jgi:nitroreductase
MTQENIEAQIIYQYHSIEKGLTHINFREGFGKRALTTLMYAMKQFMDHSYDMSSISFQTGVSVLMAYVKRHKDTKIDTSHIEAFISQCKSMKDTTSLGGIYTMEKEELISKSKQDFKSLAFSRYSVRDYSDEEIELDVINEALYIAQKTPSVCNRQAWHSYIIRNKALLKETIDLQGGFRGQGEHMDTLILVTANNHYFSDYTERNQGFVDSGLYAMSLMYALQSQGLATCPLNADFTVKTDKKMRDLLNIPDRHTLIMFISVGHYTDSVLVTKSQREDYTNKITVYE